MKHLQRCIVFRRAKNGAMSAIGHKLTAAIRHRVGPKATNLFCPLVVVGMVHYSLWCINCCLLAVCQFGESQKLRLVRILRSTVMVRVGGGWVALDEFLVKNDPCRGMASVLLPRICPLCLHCAMSL